MKGDGLTAGDWQVINQYVVLLRPLLNATSRLEGRGKSGRFGAIYEVIPTFDSLLTIYEAEKARLSEVDYNSPTSPEDHFKTNVNLGWAKLNKYYSKLDDSPAYYAATILHPYYKYFCDNAWQDRPEWLATCNAAFQELWAGYRDEGTTPAPPPRKRVKLTNEIQDHIAQFAAPALPLPKENTDEFVRWKKNEPQVAFESDDAVNPIAYWLRLRVSYPRLSQLALDVLSIPASSSDCERMFSELGDLLEPRRLKMRADLVSALQCCRAWRRQGFKTTPKGIQKVEEQQIEVDGSTTPGQDTVFDNSSPIGSET
jgi:hypothetical protein